MKSFDQKLFEIVTCLLYLAIAIWAAGLGLAFIPTVTKHEWAFVYSDWFAQFLLYSMEAMLALLSILIGIGCGQKLNEWFAARCARRKMHLNN